MGIDFQRHTFDVIVVGAGGAGLRAAIEASAQGAKTAIICKSLLGKAHTVMAEGGAAAALGNVRPEDNWRVHFRDTMRGGKMHGNWRMAQIHAQEAPDRIRELEQWGALFDRTKDGKISQRPFGGHTYTRLAHVGDRTGLEIIRVLQDKGVHSGISVFMEFTVFHLPLADGRVAGALAYDRERGRFHLFGARAVILATGGIGKAWQITSNSWEYTGDGHALAYRAGAELIDMEFVQFHPTGMVWPPSVRGILVTEGVRGEGGVLRNSEGKRFMYDYLPDMFRGEFAETDEEADRWVAGDQKNNRRPIELLTRDVVARAITSEIKAGRGSKHGGVYLSIAEKRGPEYIKKKLPSMYHQFKELAGVDITREAMEVGPTTHYVMGGVKVDPETQETNVPGLYAAGETAAGLHGANRLGGNSLSDLLVFGRRAGGAAAEAALAVKSGGEIPDGDVQSMIQQALAPFEREGGENPYAVQADLQRAMQENAGIVRDEAGLRAALADIEKLRARAAGVGAWGHREFNPGWHTCLDLQNLLIVSEATCRGALLRTESRGGHTRTDFPESDPKQARVEYVIRRRGEEMTVEARPQPDLPPDLDKIIKEGA
ncbi:MAG: fumarate reductase/succinate dehydrogenase flavoprotein subunit [Candidatus Sumerlaeia bacterium]|nr:fumarate reductase/succinate dehydrogenase flavoprotein subunit [Candidatus Sumerlaeia bacterium]